MTISIKSENEIATMREAGKRLAKIMAEIEKEIRPGIDTLQLDKLAEELVFEHGATPAFKGYGEKHNPFPATLCTSVNDEVVHGIPSETVILSEGDILKVDIGIKYMGFYSDMARTFAVGKISNQAKKIIETVEKSFWKGVRHIKEDVYLSDYCKEAEKTVVENGFSVVKNLVGHGIGKRLHEDPQIPNYFERGFRDIKLKAGMTLAIEPMINEGTYNTILGEDEWVFKTADGKLSAHYENTILVTKKGVEVLTV